jgi:hypothetical protein
MTQEREENHPGIHRNNLADPIHKVAVVQSSRGMLGDSAFTKTF